MVSITKPNEVDIFLASNDARSLHTLVLILRNNGYTKVEIEAAFRRYIDATI